MSTSDPTHAAPSPSDSVLFTLARAAMAAEASPDQVSWPHLDLGDAAQRSFGDYELLEEIGRGGMGVVYRAHQHSLDREVAIKFIAAGLADSVNVARFLAEARAAAKLLHPNIVPVYEVNSIDGLHYFSMPLIRGRTLARLLDEVRLPATDVVRLLLKLCEAIDYAHRLQLLHLDLKPANVLLDERGEPLIADFGLARHMDAAGGVDTQEVSGTPAFMAPEQILVRQYRLTTATDIYALGAILYRCLTGTSPHGEGKSDDLIRRAVAGKVQSPSTIAPNVPRDLEAICMKCLELQPDDRYRSAALLADDLRRVRDGLPVSVRRIGPLERMQRWFKREPKLALATTTAALALVLGIAATTWQWREAGTQRDAAIAQRKAADAARHDATEQRDTAQGVAALGAWLYAQQQNAGKDATGGYATTMQLLKWLQSRYPRDEHRQAVVLTEFAKATQADTDDAPLGDRWRTDGLLMPVVHAMGKVYRERLIAALVAGREPNRYLLAARLAWNNEEYAKYAAEGSDARPLNADTEADRFAELMAKAIAAQPSDPAVWETAAVYCASTGTHHTRCSQWGAVRKLTELAPDNAYYWLLLMMENEGDVARAALHEAARRSFFDDTFRSRLAGYLEAIEKAHVHAPELLSGPAQALAPNTAPEFAIASAELAGLTLVPLEPFWRRCNPANHYFTDATAYSDCRTVGTLMARSKGSVLTLMIGASVAQRLARGTPLENEMIQVRRQYLFMQEAIGKLSMRQYKNYPFQRFHEDYMTLGEQGAWMNLVAFYGFPNHPSADWRPRDACALKLPEARAACLSAHSTPSSTH